MGSLPVQRGSSNYYSPTSHHVSMLQQVVGESDVTKHHVRSYKRSFNGFAAKLSEKQREMIAAMDSVVSVFPSKTLQIQTTRSWDFVGLHESVKRQKKEESDLVIGLIDTGIWPESDSFTDQGVGPIPTKWKGHCKGGANFTCNNKIIGARVYKPPTNVTNDDDNTARDIRGHGTHTASTAAGNTISGASYYGLARGTARGAVPSARIATYKVCYKLGCNDANVLAAFDDAIADGVDIISISLGGDKAVDLVKDPIAIGSFHAMERGILTVQSAGNSGPASGSICSVAPWLLTVAASTIDRQFIDKVVLENGMTLVGRSVNAAISNGTKFPIAKWNASDESCKGFSNFCQCLGSESVKGKFVLCTSGGTIIDEWPYVQGAVGSITTSLWNPDNDESEVTFFPSVNLNRKDYNIVQNYTNSAKNPKAEILKSEISKDRSAPKVASFSSRGPNHLIPEIMKPDVSAPGVDILAAWSPVVAPSQYGSDNRKVKYNVLSGTSMACPHVAGVAAYVKSFHPDWSPAAIKSAIMTTTDPLNGNYDLSGEFSYGSGNVNPVKAIHPGLVYDIQKKDYVKMLCNYGYSAKKVKIVTGANSSICHGAHHRSFVKDLNYPAITINVEPLEPYIIKVNRTVTNVGFPHNSTYKATVSANLKMNITVEPEILRFDSLHERKSFVVTIAGRALRKGSAVSSSLVWSDGKHDVKSPIIVFVS
ncbi:subtilisin-like protease SBT4.3 [Lotus japonicus]|uniref:subtilisin-like protease SBT4.3 n=1 Tax=Lotus japonicus TaxID=34305 RepID=UPI00258B136D|nr:subtilisin-like protease SBT4.3 [Lotus japonicus]